MLVVHLKPLDRDASVRNPHAVVHPLTTRDAQQSKQLRLVVQRDVWLIEMFGERTLRLENAVVAHQTVRTGSEFHAHTVDHDAWVCQRPNALVLEPELAQSVLIHCEKTIVDNKTEEERW